MCHSYCQDDEVSCKVSAEVLEGRKKQGRREGERGHESSER